MRRYFKNGSLKPIPEENKGLPNLPKEVRKEMGYMKDGGRVKFNKGGGADASKFHTKKDGTTAKKGLYYYMNRAKKNKTSKPGKGSVTDEALKASAKTAKKT